MFTHRWNLLRPAFVRGLSGMLLFCANAEAQEPRPMSSGAAKTFTSRTTFQLPVEIDAATRATLKAIKLYVRTPDGNWVLQEAAEASQTGFGFRADRDGEYWFHIVTVDKAGKHRPSSLENIVPNRAIVVDTRPPGIWHDITRSRSGDYFLRISIRDANPDYDSLKVSVQGNPGQPWLDLVRVPENPDLFRLVDPTVLNGGMARVFAADKVGLTVSTDVRLAPPVNRQDSTPAIVAAVASVSVPNPLPFPMASTSLSSPLLPMPMPVPVPAVESIPEIRIEPPIPGPPLPKLNLPAETPRPLAPAIRGSILPPARPPVIADSGIKAPATVPTAFRTPEAMQADIPSAPQTQGNGNPRQQTSSPLPLPLSVVETVFRPLVAPSADKIGQVKTLRFPLRYETDGGTNLEFWASRDLGRNWQMLRDESAGISPATLTLPGEGAYAICILDAGSGPPKLNSTPDYWIEADTTRPLAVLTKTAIGEGADEGTLAISWIARDGNMAEKPISLYYQGPDATEWTPIVKNLAQGQSVASEGSYRWKLPANIGTQLTIRLDALDRAGNVGSALSSTVYLDRFSTPAKVIGVRSDP